MAKQAINKGIEMDLTSGLEMEKASYAQVNLEIYFLIFLLDLQMKHILPI